MSPRAQIHLNKLCKQPLSIFALLVKCKITINWHSLSSLIYPIVVIH